MIQNFQQARRMHRVNRAIQILLILCLALSINHISSNHFARKDLTPNGQNSLSVETLAYLKTLEAPIRIILTKPAEGAREETKLIYKDLQRILRQYSYANRNRPEGKVIIEVVDIYRQARRAAELTRDYKLNPDADQALIVIGPHRYRQVFGYELYRQNEDEQVFFTAERALTAAILEVSRPETTRIYFTQGHGEMSPEQVGEQRGLSQLKAFLNQRNHATFQLDLTEAFEVPEAAELVIIASPQEAFLGIEQEKLRRWLERKNGKLWLLLDPGQSHGLEDLLYEWGILANDMLIVEGSRENTTPSNQLLVSRFAQHPSMQLIYQNGLKVLLGPSRPITPNIATPEDERLKAKVLMQSSKQSWAERHYQESPMHFEADFDLMGPVGLAMASERSSGKELGLELQNGRLLVIGNASFISNKNFRAGTNALFVNEMLNWTLNNENLLNIPIQLTEEQRLNISKEEIRKILLYLMAPSAILSLLGLSVYTIRRR